MCLLGLLDALFRRRTPPRSLCRPIALESSALGELHPEIIIHVTRFLPAASAASFAFCCLPISNILGTRYWEALRTEDEQQREDFLSLLLKDLPDYILCYHCMALHSGSKERHDDRMLHRHGITPCHKEELLGGVSKYIHQNFSFDIFQMAMKRYRLGVDCNYHLNLLALKISRLGIGRVPCQCMAEARIITGSLFLRVQQVVLLPSSRALKTIASCHITICPHLGIVSQDGKVRPPENAECTIAHPHNLKQCVRRSGLKQCNYCTTEYQVDLQECGQPGVAVIITKWLDLGEGRTVLDPKWWSRLSAGYTRHRIFAGADGIYKRRTIDRLPVSFEPGSIHTSFEQDEHLAFDSLLTQDRANDLFKILA
jgi:hypothetical protein